MAKKIQTTEKELASVYFTLSNMALLHLVQNNRNLISEYQIINSIVWSETDCGIEEELDYWRKEVNKAVEGSYVYDEWQKQRENYIIN
jgi:hypothetical protein